INIEGNQYVNDKVILSKLGIKKGKNVSVFDIENGISAIFGSNNFSKVTYEINKVNPLSNYILTIRTYEKKPATIRGAFHYDNTFSAGIVLNVTLRNLPGKSSRTMFITDISKNPKFRLDFLKYVGPAKRAGLNLRYEYLNQQIPNYQEGEINDIDISKENNFYAGLITTQSLKRSLYLGLSYQFNNQKSKFKKIVPEGIKNGAFNFARADLIFQINTFNDRNYPISGRELKMGGNIYFANEYKIRYDKGIDTIYFPLSGDENISLPLSENQFNDLIVKPFTPETYVLAFFSYIEYFELAKRFQILPLVSLGVTLSKQEEAIFNNYRIGGYQRVRFSDNPFIGLNYTEVDYENFLITGLYFQNILLKNIYLMYSANLLLPQEHIPLDDLDSFNFSEMFENNSLLGYGLELTYKSFLGPISFGLNRNTRDPYFRYYLSIGYSFNFSD
ncbi:MAG: hypothetical protein JW731_02845, partial [Bacteroidales bacterium]|nr:hypothetical protein [Bacteroidales bacterium]